MRRFIPGLRWQIAVAMWAAVMLTSLLLLRVADGYMWQSRDDLNTALHHEAIAEMISRWEFDRGVTADQLAGSVMQGSPSTSLVGDPTAAVWEVPSGAAERDDAGWVTTLTKQADADATVMEACALAGRSPDPWIITPADKQGNTLAANKPMAYVVDSACNSDDTVVMLPRPAGGYLMARVHMRYADGARAAAMGRDMRSAALRIGIFAALGAYLLSGALMRPARRAGEVARRLGAGDLDARVDVRGRDEIAQLGRRLNEMADSLQATIDSQHHFVSDTAHELRTPTAALLASASALENPVTRDEAATMVVPQLRRLSELTESLLALSRFDDHREQLDAREVDVVELCRVTVAQVAPDADAKVLADGPVMAVVDPTRAATIVRNLVVNALRHGAPPVRVLVSTAGDNVRVRVEDAGDGVPAAVRDTIFDRFVRADTARHGGGAGLGLAIARENALLHGGSLRVAADGHGFTLELPRAPRPVAGAATSPGRRRAPVSAMTQVVTALFLFGGTLTALQQYAFWRPGLLGWRRWLASTPAGQLDVVVITLVATALAMAGRWLARRTGHPRGVAWCALSGLVPLLGWAARMHQWGTVVALLLGWVAWTVADLWASRREAVAAR